MVFSTSSFLFLFLPGTLIIYFILYATCKRLLNAYLFLASLVFYCWNGLQYVVILLAAILISYLSALLVETAKKPAIKKLILAISVVCLLGMLAYFKYAGFILENITRITGHSFDVAEILLPIGISFYTFQALSYIIDVYRGASALKNPLDLGMYITFFPQLIAGPIIRYGQIKDRIKNRKTSIDQVLGGLELFCVGLCKKVIIANNLGVFVDQIFSGFYSQSFSLLNLWAAAIGFSLQLYYDFSGYSDMAIGLGKVFGFEFPKNFDYPYFASTITDFWRRWHISLSSWFRDYLYIPLGGSRKGIGRHIFNLFVVWFATGLWHGAGWTYLAWGLGYFVLIVLEKYLIRPERFKNQAVKILYRLFTLLCVVCLFVVFRSDSLGVALKMLKAMFGFNAAGVLGNLALANVREYAFYFVAGIVFSFPLTKFLERKIPKIYQVLRTVAITCGTLLAVSYILADAYNPFLYFQF